MNKLGKYQIRRPLGKGAMGVVYEGFDPVIERTVAIKTILPAQLNSADAMDIMARFKREAQAAGRLNHPGIVAVYDYGEEIAQDVSEEDATMMAVAPASTQRIAYIAMEFVKGKELKEYLDKGDRFPLAEVARIMGEILDAMDHAHAQGVIHRDMKPANVMLLDGGRIKVADFGIARVEASELTQAGTVMGTPSYMSPEQFMGHTVDGRSDLFSCGVILYQLLTGERPFTGETSTTIMYKVLREEPAPPSALNLSLAPALDAVVAKALAKQPAQRFQNGRAFAAALRAAIAEQAEESAVPLAAGQTQPAMATATASQPFAAVPTAIVPPQPRRPVGAWVAAGAAAIAVVAGGYAVLMPGRTGAPPVAQAAAPATAPVAAAVPAAAEPAAAPVATPAAEAGTLVISALGQADPQDARFAGNLAAAQTEARNDARRQLVEKALALYVDKGSLDSNYGLIEQKLLSNSGAYIRTVLQEGAPVASKSGVLETETRAVVNIRDVQKSLNQLSREERVEFIRNKGDPRISIQIAVGSADAATPFPKERSHLAENVVKERIKSFGFRVWTPDGEGRQGGNAQPADFAIRGEVKVKQLSVKLPASGLTITKTALTSWTIKAVDLATGEEVYLSTRLPTGQSFASEDMALAEIGKLVGDEFSRNFFLQHFSFRTQRTSVTFTGLPESSGALIQRELRGMRPVLDAQMLANGKFQVQLPEGSTPDIVQESIIRPLNAKLGQECLALAGSREAEVTVAFAPGCATPEVRARLEGTQPAGWLQAPGLRGKGGKPAGAPRTAA